MLKNILREARTVSVDSGHKLGISIKLKENAWIFKSGLSWVKYKQHEGQCFPDFSSVNESLKQFFIFTGNPNYEKV
jgi:hypothetical protein